MNKELKAPCNECPFTRTSRPGNLGGSSPETYIGQAAGPFLLPCHRTCDFEDPEWRDKIDVNPQCAGAAIFRTHINVAEFMPDDIHLLPSNVDKVFSTSAEFLSHHTGVSLSYATVLLKITPPSVLLRNEMSKASVKVFQKG